MAFQGTHLNIDTTSELLLKGVQEQFKQQLEKELFSIAEKITQDVASKIAENVSVHISSLYQVGNSTPMVELKFNVIDSTKKPDGVVVQAMNGTPMIAWNVDSEVKSGDKVYIL